ncbi:undecaprenyl-diphosphate phosphatase [bacterium D16-76]|nr:undecaprenyl-diphosphate phosphatase [bacterium D16-76]
MTIFDAALQGIIQGATEFLPVSSSGHLSISQHLFGIQLPGILFDIMLHLGTLAAVVFVYRQLVWRLIKEFFSLCGDILHKQFKWGEMSRDRRLLMMLIIGLVPLFLLFLPIPGTGMKIKDFSEMLASDTSILMEGLSLLLTSALLFLGIHANKQNQQKMVKNRDGALVPSKGRRKIHTVDALVIGFTQCMAAVFPGLSRSGSTLSVGLMRGISQQTALDYSFVLGIPSIAAAALVSLKDIGSTGESIGAAPLIVGVVVSAIVGFLAIKLLRWIVTTNKMEVFAYYTLIAGGIVTVLGIIEHIIGKNLFTGLPL